MLFPLVCEILLDRVRVPVFELAVAMASGSREDSGVSIVIEG